MKKHLTEEASFGDLIISYLLSCHSTKIQKKVLFELVKKKRMLNKQSFNNNLYRLKDKGIFSFDSEKNIVINRNDLNQHVTFRLIQGKPAGDIKVMVLFDIPEKKRKIRNWLRSQLKFWEFEMIQQSVWLGRGQLPKEFRERLKFFGVDKCVKTLKVQSVK